MTSEGAKVVEQFFTVMQEESPAEAARRFGTDDLVWWSPGAGEIQGALEGLAALIEQHFVDGRIAMELTGVTDGGDRIAVEARSRGTLHSGAVYANSYHWLFVLRDGKIATIKEYNDTAHLRDVLGPIMGG